MSSTVSAAALRELHRLHSQLSDLRGRLDRGPKQVAAHKGSVAQLEAALQAAKNHAQETRKAADRKQLDVKAQEDKIANWENQLNTAKSNKEFQTFQEQIAAARMAASVLEDETLELLGRIDETAAEVGRHEERLAAGQAELKKVAANVAANATTLEAEVARLEADLAVAEKALPGDFKLDYQRVVAAKGADGLAPCEDGVCEGCGQSTTLQMQSDLKASKPVFCKSCGVLLYLPE
ncbi:putative zinc ribbon domain protein [Botrimarina colliarenosi]|uniref:Putative zinc ribbon domain protein n=1 Tax=Botrimarina colliarenosi TaxID=2528001 RepID=A0A5C6A3W4_9BACT|nr:phospholipase [Botrimarina colliarenosi]TWT94096.1 putative zinc ribbon domain protein [Botrimarina colliarenosi]